MFTNKLRPGVTLKVAAASAAVSLSAGNTQGAGQADPGRPQNDITALMTELDASLGALRQEADGVTRELVEVERALQQTRADIGALNERADNTLERALRADLTIAGYVLDKLHVETCEQVAREMVAEIEQEFKEKRFVRRDERELELELRRRIIDRIAERLEVFPQDRDRVVALVASSNGEFGAKAYEVLYGREADKVEHLPYVSQSTCALTIVANRELFAGSGIEEKKAEERFARTARDSFSNFVSIRAVQLTEAPTMDKLKDMPRYPHGPQPTPDFPDNWGEKILRDKLKEKAVDWGKKGVGKVIEKLTGIKPSLPLGFFLPAPALNVGSELPTDPTELRILEITAQMMWEMERCSREYEGHDLSSPTWKGEGGDPLERDGGIRGYDKLDREHRDPDNPGGIDNVG